MASHQVNSHRRYLDDGISPEDQRLHRLMARAAMMIVDGAGDDEGVARCRADVLGAVLASYVVQEMRRRGGDG